MLKMHKWNHTVECVSMIPIYEYIFEIYFSNWCVYVTQLVKTEYKNQMHKSSGES